MYLLTIFFSFLTFSSLIGHGFILSRIFQDNTKNLINLFAYGSIAIIFWSLTLNFFTPLNTFITNSFFYISVALGIFYILIKLLDKKRIKEIIFIIFFSSIILYKSYSQNDYSLYHLPYIEIIRNFKIIFGLSNLEFRFGHTSIFQNIAAFNYNNLMKADSYVFFTPLLIALLLVETYKIYSNKSHYLVALMCFIFLSYFLIHANRYGALGNDYPSQGLAFFLFIIFLIFLNNVHRLNQKEHFNLFLSVIFICLLSKLSLIILFPFIIIIFLKYKNIIKASRNFIIFLIFLFSIFAIKNFINTSCFIFPTQFTCFQTNWTPDEYTQYHPKYVSLFSQIAVKDYSNSDFMVRQEIKDKIITKAISENTSLFNNLSDSKKYFFKTYYIYKAYNNIKVWVFPWYENNFKNKILKELLAHLAFILIINFFVWFFRNKNIEKNGLKNFYNFEIGFLFIFNAIAIIIWFFMFPLLRYGISYLLILVTFFAYMQIYFLKMKLDMLKKTYNIILIILFIYSLSENILRIYNFDNLEHYNNNIVPLENFPSKNEFINGGNLSLVGSFCGINKPLCLTKNNYSHFTNCKTHEPLCLDVSNYSHFVNSFEFKNANGYIFINRKKE